MTETRPVRVTFRKQVSDGNYGTEAAEVTLEDCVLDTVDTAQVLLADARALVHAELANSPSQRVRATLKERVYAPDVDDDR